MDCDEPVCGSKKDMFMKSMGIKPGVNCPLNKEELGNSAWKFLHTTAAYFPDEPTEAQQQAAQGLVTSIATLYPCVSCREHFRNETEDAPIRTDSRKHLSQDLCRHHNLVNEILDKPLFHCDMETLDKRWRKNAEC